MAKQIKGNDIVQSDALNPHIAELKEVLNLYKQIEAQVTKTAKDIKKISGSADANSAQGIQKMNKALVDSNKLRKESIAVTKQKKTVTDQLRQAEDAEVKGKLRLLEAKKNQRTLLKEEIALEDKQIGTLKRLAIENAKLRREREALNLDTKKGQTRLKEINSALDQNNAKIRANSDAMKKQRLNVGNYGKAVSKVSGILKGFGATLLAAFSFQAIKGFFTSSISAFQSQEKAVAKVNQALKSTQNAAGKTSEELQKLASDLQGTTLFADEDILNNATAQLLTFTNIAGTNFDRTQKVALDLATVLDGDLKSASIQLGKALNDPVANLSALSRSGIQFSESQKQVIKSLTESGKLAEAQTVILDELERQYGGQAEAAAEADGGLTQLSNAFGDFKEKAGKAILEGLKPFIKGLKEFFESLTQEDIEAFIEKLVFFGKVLLKLVGIFSAYKVAIKAANAANNLFGKSIVKNVKGAGLWAAALGLVVTAAIEIVNRIKNVRDVQDRLNEVVEETNNRLEEEKIKLQLVGRELFNTKLASEERGAVLEKINKEYGTTLKNLDDEAAFANQVAEAYKAVVKQLRNKIEMEVLQEKIKDTIREISDLKDEIKDIGVLDTFDFVEGTLIDDNAFQRLENAEGALEEMFKDLAELQGATVSGKKSLGGLADRFEDVADSAGNASGEVKKLNKVLESPLDGILSEDKEADFESFKRNLQQNTREFETELRKRGLAEKDIQEALKERRLQDLKDERDRALELFGESSQKFLDLDLAVRREVDKRREEDAKKEAADREARRKEDEKEKKEQLERAKETANKMLEITKILADNKIAQIDREIEARKNEISVSESEIGRLQDLAAAGNVDAAESIKAERVRQAQDKIEIENLEKKKADLLLKIATLNQANLLFQQSDVNGFQNANAKVKEFVSNLPTFYDGTTGTVADALGATGTRDGHMVRVHDNEHIIGSNDSTTLHAAGLKNNADIVGSALAYQNAAASNKALASGRIAAFTDSNIVNELQDVKKAIKDIKIVQQHIDLSTGMETIVDGNKTTRNNHRPTSFRI